MKTLSISMVAEERLQLQGTYYFLLLEGDTTLISIDI
jgi:hypothetical protein